MSEKHNVFFSYARRDKVIVSRAVEGLRLLGKEVWLDESLAGGQAWWDAILNQVRQCNIFVQSVSPAALDSEACSSERKYALALGKPVLPVLVEAVRMELLPSNLAPLQVVDYTEPTQEAAFRLARALESCPPALSLPTELPPPPPVPISYLGSLSERVRAPELTLDEQLALVARLRTAVERDDDRSAAIELLRRLEKRDDLYVVPAREIERVLGADDGRDVEVTVAEPPATDGAASTLREPAADDRERWRVDLLSKSTGRRSFRVTLGASEHVVRLEQGLRSAIAYVDEIEAAKVESPFAKLEFHILDGATRRSVEIVRATRPGVHMTEAFLIGATVGGYRRIGPVRFIVDDTELYEG